MLSLKTVKGWSKKKVTFLKITSLLKSSLWTYTLSNLHETLTDLGPSVGSKSVKVSWRLLNVYVHSDDFSKEVIFKNVTFFLAHPLSVIWLREPKLETNRNAAASDPDCQTSFYSFKLGPLRVGNAIMALRWVGSANKQVN